ncbi:MAG: SAM-dependent methyltransferase [Paludibacter sp.]|jgi:16S rRNA (cytidine1402-2'-O)-methyltransferase|nr:SAM-dependent methyltransferase [Paludibacter sp.]
MSKLYLIPAPLGENMAFDKVFPPVNAQVINVLDCFVVENVRTARRFIKKIAPDVEIEHLTFAELNEHTKEADLECIVDILKSGRDIGLMSEAGCPAIADPGADVVALSQRFDYEIIPLVGASSILLSLMASGFNGQSFAFLGYLPVKEPERTKTIRKIENRAHNEQQTQIFIETPYRNMKLLDELLKILQPHTRLCIAADLTLPTQYVRTKSIAQWKKALPDINKRPCVFLIYK